MAIMSVPGSVDAVNGVLEQLFRGHGVETVRDGDGLRFPAHPALWGNGELFREFEVAIQFDVRLGLADGRVLIESTGGLGDSQDAQIQNALARFADSSFHILLTAFFGLPECHGTQQLEWEIGGRKRVVYLGLITSWFGYPPGADGQPDMRFFDHFERHLQAQPLPPGTHWVRLYQMRFRGEDMCNEVLLDNAPWDPVMTAMAEFDWPVSENPYDVRVFLVIADPD
jgi:hypothetical protein